MSGSQNGNSAMPEVIQKTAGVLGGDARIRNTRIAVWMIVRARQLGLSDEQILADYPGLLEPADLKAAWHYYRDHRAEIDAAIRENEGTMPTVIQKTPDVIGGDACIRDTRIAVWMLVQARRLGMSDPEIRDRYDPPLSEEDLDAAWRYYERHREEIDQAIRDNEDD
jgi:type III restriction enzyme